MSEHHDHTPDSTPETAPDADAIREAILTAYAVGELDEAASETLRQKLEADPAMQAELDAIHETTELLEDLFTSEPALELTPEQRERIERGPGRASLILSSRRIWAGAGLAAAACVAAAFFVVPMLQPAPTTVVSDLSNDTDEKDERAAGIAREFSVATPADDTVIPSFSGELMEVATSDAASDELLRQLSAALSESPMSLKSIAPSVRPSAAPPPTRGRRRTFDQRIAPPGTMPLPSPAEAAPFADPAAGAAGDAYPRTADNPFVVPRGEGELSTIAMDVDTASYANVRRLINGGHLPPSDAVRIEEMINYFSYDDAPATGDHPIAASIEIAACPWNSDHRLLRVGVKARNIAPDVRPATNLVFLLDVSGSMNQAAKLPLVKQSLKLLVDQLVGDDRIAMVVYAGSAGLVLDSTYCNEKQVILDALDRLRAGGSTNGGKGIELAYSVARDHYIEGGVNRVILCTDGDFNVGVTGEGELEKLITRERESGVELSVLGFGSGNWQDGRMQILAEKGNGNASYIDSLDEAKKVLVEEMGGTLVTVAKDVKLQVAFNPATVASYRLIGYASRLLEAKDFRDDTKDAGEIGAGHSLTVLYEIEPGVAPVADDNVEHVFQKPVQWETVESDLTARVMMRYKAPGATVDDTATEFAVDVLDTGGTIDDASPDLQFASAVAAFGMLLRDSEHRGSATYDLVLDLASPAAVLTDGSYRREFLRLVEAARTLVEAADGPAKMNDDTDR